ncbi:PTS sugar transporter subunit IIA [Atopobacter sp. AH10]|uniref:PTS sugar transporter subunit IIA n=1 Tax=Atopobacter sp. AH10 TaxID=2315861 RepID=UPI000EF292B7|nr:PTS sugar transporter subunit IIA [Atopobacter sp. AH10]RLK63489.1 PTS sugar transporter subunit IIA [Atopobacter sp. AH10]
MFHIVIASHGSLSQGLKDAADVIIGNVDHISTISLNKGESIEAFGSQLKSLIEEKNSEDGVLVFTDLLSASPYNQSVMAIYEMEQVDKVHILTGVNMPMLLEAVNHQLLATSLEEAIPLIQEQGAANISHWHISMYKAEEDDFVDDF